MICPGTAGSLCQPMAVIVLLWPRFMPFDALMYFLDAGAQETLFNPLRCIDFSRQSATFPSGIPNSAII